jgi:hypothetical protein
MDKYKHHRMTNVLKVILEGFVSNVIYIIQENKVIIHYLDNLIVLAVISMNYI